MMTLRLIALLVLALAWANGANDVAKGVATLTGGGVASARHAIVWGTLCTMLGGLAAMAWGGALVSTFSKGFLAAGFPVSLTFVVGVMVGAAGWVFTAPRLGLPVSTTHVSTGALMGIRWGEGVKPDQADALKAILFGWVITLPVAALLAAGTVWLSRWA